MSIERKNFLTVVAILIVGLLLASCTAAPIQNDGDFNYRALSYQDIDEGFFNVTGYVEPMFDEVDMVGPINVPYRAFRDDENGKWVHIMRILLTEDVASTEDGRVDYEAGDIVGVKVYGSLVNAFMIGDHVNLRCRNQKEAIGAAAPQETLNPEFAIVIELENCRPLSALLNDEVGGR